MLGLGTGLVYVNAVDSVIPYANSASVPFDGANQYITIPDHDDFSFTDGVDDKPFSISAWFYMSDNTHIGTLVSKHDPSGQEEWWLVYDGVGKKMTIRCFDDSATDYIGRKYNPGSNFTAHINKWTHVVATYDASEAVGGFQFYIDGSAVPSDTNSAGSYSKMTAGSETVLIGARHNGGSQAELFKGSLDEISIFNKVLD